MIKIDKDIEVNNNNIPLNNLNNYSNQEMVIGTWLGKALYRKCGLVEIENLNGMSSFETGLENVEICRIEGYWKCSKYPQNVFPLNHFNIKTNYNECVLLYTVNKGKQVKVEVYNLVDIGIIYLWYILEYTKP